MRERAVESLASFFSVGSFLRELQLPDLCQHAGEVLMNRMLGETVVPSGHASISLASPPDDETRKLGRMEPIDFDEYVDVLRQRIFDYEALHNDGSLPNFAELMDDYAGVAPGAWPVQAYEELLAQGHLNDKVSGMTSGPNVFGLLSANGRLHVREQRREEAD